MKHLLNPQWMVQTALATISFFILQAIVLAGWKAEVTRDILELRAITATQEGTHARKETLDAMMKGIDGKLEMILRRIEK